MKYWRLLGEYDAETTTWSEFAGGGGSSPYNPVEDARLVGLRAVCGRDAATSLTDHVEFRLSCAAFTPNTIEVGITGSGLQTAPSLMAGVNAQSDWDVSQPVKAGTPITLEGRNLTADTPVTNALFLYGCFDNGKG